jgi:DNA-binding transcriptional MerR regulator
VATGSWQAVSEATDGRADQSATDSGELTIDALARETGMTVRNIRAHQSRGLLPPPEVRARTGYYGPEHVARLRLIHEMQADGFNLVAIKRLLAGAGSAAEAALGLKRAITAPFETEEPEVMTAKELTARFGAADGRAVSKAERLGVVRSLGNDSFEVPSPSLLRAAEEVMARGVSLEAALAVVEDVKRHCEGVARRFVKLFVDDVWKPFEDADRPQERWPEVVESIERLRPIASDVLLAVFRQTMTNEVEAAFGKQLERGRRRGR